MLPINLYFIFIILQENEIAELRQKYIDLYDKFEQNKLIAMKCAKLADIILNVPETYDANIINVRFKYK